MQRAHLRRRRRGVRGIGVGHRLHDDRVGAAHHHAADVDYDCLSTSAVGHPTNIAVTRQVERDAVVFYFDVRETDDVRIGPLGSPEHATTGRSTSGPYRTVEPQKRKPSPAVTSPLEYTIEA